MKLNHITVNTQSSIRIEGSQILYFDPYLIQASRHDADIVFITHDHYDHFEPDSILKVRKESTLLVAPESMKKRCYPTQAYLLTNVSSIGPGSRMIWKILWLRLFLLTIS